MTRARKEKYKEAMNFIKLARRFGVNHPEMSEIKKSILRALRKALYSERKGR